MKKILLIVCLVSVCSQALPSDKKKSNTFELKVNLTRPILPYEEVPKIGFGLEASKIWFPDKKLNLRSGVVLNNVNYYLYSFRCGNACRWTDINYHAYSLSIPVLARYSIGKSIKFYIEAGPEFNFVPLVHTTATLVKSPPVGDGVPSDISRNTRNELVTPGYNIGTGLIIPIAGRDYIISSSYHNLLTANLTRNNQYSNYYTVQIGTIIK